MQVPLPGPDYAVTEKASPGDCGLGYCDDLAKSYLSPYPQLQDGFATKLIAGARVHLPSAVTARWPNNTIGKTIHKALKQEHGGHTVQTFASEGFCPFGFSFEPPDKEIWGVAECSLKSSPEPDPSTSAIGKAFVDHLGTCLIPYDLSERRAKFGQAFHDLRDYISRREEVTKKKTRAPSVEA